MAFCQSCGSPVEGRFCAKCGAATGLNPGTGATTSAIPPAASGAPDASGAPTLADNIAGALCYIPILGVIFLLVEPYNRNKLIRFHAFQSLFLVAAMFVTNIVVGSVFEAVLGFWGISVAVRLGFFALWIFLILKTFKGNKIVLPFLGPLAEKQA